MTLKFIYFTFNFINNALVALAKVVLVIKPWDEVVYNKSEKWVRHYFHALHDDGRNADPTDNTVFVSS